MLFLSISLPFVSKGSGTLRAEMMQRFFDVCRYRNSFICVVYVHRVQNRIKEINLIAVQKYSCLMIGPSVSNYCYKEIEKIKMCEIRVNVSGILKLFITKILLVIENSKDEII